MRRKAVVRLLLAEHLPRKARVVLYATASWSFGRSVDEDSVNPRRRQGVRRRAHHEYILAYSQRYMSAPEWHRHRTGTWRGSWAVGHD